MSDSLTNAMKSALDILSRGPGGRVKLFHHNDTDGLTSGAILTRAFQRAGYSISRICLEKPYPAVLEKIFQNEKEILIFADFAGRIAPLLSKMNEGRNLVLILDHHIAEPSEDSSVINLDPDLFNLKGDRDISASTTCYLFAVAMDKINIDLAFLATLGAVGDEFFVDGKLAGENRKVMIEAVNQGLVRVEEHEKGERYFFKSSRGEVSGENFSEYLDILGGAGFYKGGPEAGIRVCLDGFNSESDNMVEKLRKIKDEKFAEEIKKLKQGEMFTTRHIQWFHVQNRLWPMGVKMIGTLCDKIKNMDFLSNDKYLAGFQIIPNEIPGFGEIKINQVKVSMRVSSHLENRIREGNIMGLDAILPEATGRLGGFSDACHSLTAATTIDLGKEELLIQEMENILG